MASSPRALASLAAIALLLACGPEEDEEGLALEGRSFLSTSVTESDAPRALVSGTRLWLTFEQGGELSAWAGCNLFSGGYEVEGGTLVMSVASESLVGCGPELSAQDDWYFGFLFSRPAIEVDGDSLVLEGADTRIEYLDQEVATPDVALTGVTWTVESITEGGISQSTEWPSPATLELADDGTVEVSTGCNDGSGTYAVAGTALTFADVSVSERGCDEQPTGRLERVVLGVIYGPQPVTWEITVDRLSLRGPDFGLRLVANAG